MRLFVFSRKSFSLLCISFSYILSKFDKIDIGLYLEMPSLDYFLNTGMTFPVLRFVGKTPVVTEIFKILSREEISFFNSFRTFLGILKDLSNCLGLEKILCCKPIL